MKIEKVLVDTNIWHFAYVEPTDKQFREIYLKSKQFLSSLLSNHSLKICISMYQIAELLEILRRSHIDSAIGGQIFNLIKTNKFLICELTFNSIKKCYKMSNKSGIHIYDYLTVIPCANFISKIYSADSHFQHNDFTSISDVENPLLPWIFREGIKPVKTNNT